MTDIINNSETAHLAEGPVPSEDAGEIEWERTEDEEGLEIGKTALYLIIAAVFIGFFVWLLIGLWGYLQEMTYGHG